jgi:hypothetical protein
LGAVVGGARPPVSHDLVWVFTLNLLPQQNFSIPRKFPRVPFQTTAFQPQAMASLLRNLTKAVVRKLSITIWLQLSIKEG